MLCLDLAPGQPRLKLSLKFGNNAVKVEAPSPKPKKEPNRSSAKGSRKNVGTTSKSQKRGLSALEAAKMLGTPLPERPAAHSQTPTRPAEQLRTVEDEDEVLVVDDHVLSQPNFDLQSSDDLSTRLKLCFGPTKVSIAPITTGTSENSATNSIADADDSDGSSSIEIDDEGLDGTSEERRVKKRPWPGDIAGNTPAKRVKSESTDDLAFLQAHNSDQPKMLGNDDKEEADEDIDVTSDGRPIRFARKAKSRGKGFSTRRKTGEAKGTWKPRKKGLFTVLSKLVAALKQKDHYGFFLEPVDTTIVTDYMNVVTTPMDLGTMEQKVERRKYKSCDEFREDFALVIANAKAYNAPDTMYFRAAEKLGVYGMKLIEREADTVETSMEGEVKLESNRLYDQGSMEAAGKKSEGRKKSKKMKHTEELEARTCEECMPDGTAMRGKSRHNHLASPFERYINSFMSCHGNPYIPLATDVAREFGEYGPYKYRDMPGNNTDPVFQRNVYGDDMGETYMQSMGRFAEGLGPSMQSRVDGTLDQLSCGARSLVKVVSDFLLTRRDAGAKQVSSVSTPWGAVDIQKVVHDCDSEVDRIIKAAELEYYRGEGVDIIPLLHPAGMLTDESFKDELAQANPGRLLNGNAKDLEEWNRKQKDRLRGNSQHAYEEETALAEQVRRRLLQLVQMAPAKEFENAKGLPSVEAIRAFYLNNGGLLRPGTTSQIVSNLVPSNPMPPLD